MKTAPPKHILIMACAVSILAGCTENLGTLSAYTKTTSEVPPNQNSEKLKKTALNLIKENPRSFEGHYLNGIYYSRALPRTVSNDNLARVAFSTAIKYNPSHWQSYYRRGLLEFKSRNYALSMVNLIGAASHNKSNAEIYYALALNSVILKNKWLAKKSFQTAKRLSPPKERHQLMVAALVSEMNHDTAGQQYFFNKLKGLTSEYELQSLKRDLNKVRTKRADLHQSPHHMFRLDAQEVSKNYIKIASTLSNSEIYDIVEAQKSKKTRIRLAQASPSVTPNPYITGGANPYITGGAPSGFPNSPSQGPTAPSINGGPGLGSPGFGGPGAMPNQSKTPPKTGIVDLVILQGDDISTSSTGINLLDTLSVNFTGQLFSGNWQRVTSTDPFPKSAGASPTSDLLTKTLSSNAALSLASITYSLNLANQSGSTSRIIARPSITIADQIPSTVFSGSEITIATDGQLNSQTLSKQVGLTLSVTPVFLDKGLVQLAVNSELSNISPGAYGGTFRQQMQTATSKTSATAVIRKGQTIMLSAGTGSSESMSGSKTPYLGDNFITKPFFNQRTTSQRKTSFVVLITMRNGSPISANANAITKEEKLQARKLLKRLFSFEDETILASVVDNLTSINPIILENNMYFDFHKKIADDFAPIDQ